MSKPHVIVLGNEKGGSGKSTTAMHLIVCLLRMGYRVGSLDLDARQATLSRYLANRRAYAEAQGLELPHPDHRPIPRSTLATLREAEADERARLEAALVELAGADFLVMDCPGADSALSRFGHSHADTLVTPINDSFIDLDMLASVDAEGSRILRPSVYSEMVWEQKMRRAQRDGHSIDWIVMRNRLSHLDARTKRQMGGLLTQLSKRIGFRLTPGFGERVIYRELFLKGLTLMDLKSAGIALQMSHVAARQEVRGLVAAMALPLDRDAEADAEDGVHALAGLA